MPEIKVQNDTAVPAIEKMIAKVMKRKDMDRSAAIVYMLGVATGRLAALWRYDDSLPDGKKTKGVLGLVGRKQRAPKSAKIVIPPPDESPKPKASKPAKPKAKPKAAKPKPNPPAPKPAKGEKGEQMEIATQAAE